MTERRPQLDGYWVHGSVIDVEFRRADILGQQGLLLLQQGFIAADEQAVANIGIADTSHLKDLWQGQIAVKGQHILRCGGVALRNTLPLMQMAVRLCRYEREISAVWMQSAYRVVPCQDDTATRSELGGIRFHAFAQAFYPHLNFLQNSINADNEPEALIMGWWCQG